MTDDAGPTCSECGQVNPPGQKFCGNCGSSLLVACPACGAANPPGQRFCGECGAAFPVTCPSCASLIAGDQKFCGNCGGPLAEPGSPPAPITAPAPVAPPVAITAPVPVAPSVATTAPAPAIPPVATTAIAPAPATVAPPPVEEERRLITAIFCDVVGFTPLSEALDPEEVREIQTMYFAQMNRELHRFGGSVEKYAGDAVLALFGAPVAHEDDAERAVRCALAMQQAFQPVAEMAKREWDVELAVRIGVNTGEAISGTWAVEGRQDYSATGDVVNTAARLQSSADPGGVIVGPETMHLARRAILFGPRRDLTLKGKTTAFPAYPVLGLRDQIAERWETREQRAPLVGREHELGRLMEIWDGVQTGEGHVVTLVAEAGVGKSRLLAEAVERMSSVAGTVVVRGRCLSYGQGMSLHLVADVLRNLCQLREGDDPERIGMRVRDTVESLLAPWDAETREAATDVLGSVLGLPPSPSIVANADPQVRRQTLVRSLQLMLSALSSHRPAILLLEDLHWTDTASADVIAETLPIIHDRQAIVLATHRPDWTAPWVDWPESETMTLEPLGEGDAVDLARSILGGPELEPELERQVTDRAGGNPFFVEELLRNMQETDALEERDGRIGLTPGAAEKLPSTLTELLLARLDQLDRAARSVAQHASVIGRTFTDPLLARITEQEEDPLRESLAVLEHAEIAFPRHNAAREHVFKHATIREVAYNTLLLRRRQVLHTACARGIIDLYPADEHVDIIAFHFSRTREHAEAAEWLERAADRAASVFANAAAIEQYGQARERLEKIDAPPSALARIDEKLGRTLKIVARYDEALEVLDRSADAHRASEDAEGERRVIAEIGRVHRAHGTPDEGIARVTAVLDTTADEDATSGIAALHVARARLYFNLGRYQEQLEAAGRASQLASQVADQRLLAEAEMSRSIALFLLGHTEDALTVMQATAPTAEEVGDFEVLNNLLGNIALIYRDMGDFDQSRQYRERSAEVTERMGDMANHSFALASLGEIMFFLGDWAEAEGYLDRAMKLIHSLSTSWFSSLPPLLLGHLHAARGDFAAAAECLEEALSIAQKGGHRHSVRRVIDLLAEIDLMQGNPEAGLARFDGVVDLSALDEDDSSLTETLPVVAWARLECGDAAGAASLAALGIKRAVAEHAIVELLAAQRVAGMSMAAQGEEEQAEHAFEQTIALSRQIKYPYALARALYEHGLVLKRSGELAQATSSLQEALTLFQQLGAGRYAELATGALVTTVAPNALGGELTIGPSQPAETVD